MLPFKSNARNILPKFRVLVARVAKIMDSRLKGNLLCMKLQQRLPNYTTEKNLKTTPCISDQRTIMNAKSRKRRSFKKITVFSLGTRATFLFIQISSSYFRLAASLHRAWAASPHGIPRQVMFPQLTPQLLSYHLVCWKSHHAYLHSY